MIDHCHNYANSDKTININKLYDVRYFQERNDSLEYNKSDNFVLFRDRATFLFSQKRKFKEGLITWEQNLYYYCGISLGQSPF